MATRRRPIVIPYVDGDFATHSIEQPICQDETCICADLEYELLLQETAKPVKRKRTKRTLVDQEYEVLSSAAQLNYRNRGFRLLR